MTFEISQDTLERQDIGEVQIDIQQIDFVHDLAETDFGWKFQPFRASLREYVAQLK